ncbi:hypothetical protein TSAR_003298 [Trichomalopsis sarcophagae]|uniref:Uncharacterized protein n=1 Tax=Trichomalopsis sarcophagae TaxID=543379 RepID=A0A232EFC4_9HYME|nr:hypothetical protein TSAR_003298 [Trichomalopsis sarcophagae]
MFPLDKSSVLNNVAMGVTGKSIHGKGISTNQYLDPKVLEALANNTWERMWGKFLTFGTASAALIDIIMIARLIKLLIDTVLHGYAIYSVHGFSIHFLGSIWNSVTQLLLHLGNRKPQKPQPHDELSKEKIQKQKTNSPIYNGYKKNFNDMSYEEILKKRVDITCEMQNEQETAKKFYKRLQTLRNEHRALLKLARENQKELFETSSETEEIAIIGYILGIKFDIRRYPHTPCEYKSLKESAQHALKIEHRLKQIKIPIIIECDIKIKETEERKS